MTDFSGLAPSTMNRDAFIATFGDVYEHSPWVAQQAYEQGTPAALDQIETLHERMSDILLSATRAQQLALINAHPDLAGKAAVKGELTQASSNEQAGAGIHLCTPEEFQRFTELNEAYKARFGFPFIMAVKGSDRHKILAAFEQRLHHSPEAEFACALAEINKIALFRLQALQAPRSSNV
ncbi:2-oxo-4-hydroxy-4-carboxy-5-ureidoimidazoline decarboxylase [Pseudomonas alliivorans]|uniref:2-oxo-4-hydroxy-4-carboxy-5-ureidoimidazoline decarboxylase n=1 Tax=Pseudomonas alliivorans TaxID=2810613 RepID=UPI002ED161A0|nr:2-oxo-4-hydroxy-4-carboxy-5-ureidoimidazoline decarboxylase [Pseudomonas alliivorans]MEE4964681.1 2-oxo-4-hydroxy-4-carboxy-5-ureidoimidazoline decarboxylase [Pseudomonas alliivorans]MEE4985963.1 2-oxo-4-hydroxy-4-carboxy-5-ureidoimidazoline decarboxylase [Pseudomonas alliivorans]MEE4990989.1 2-oxo-4-hydroxy-4-carboxy-5-ureidoimidazoline decarboxylase [Pseudomonas alliivorans]MEE5006575.1 2-oxo-4-hydroxy-4-carboxy-5-ureidoimidazoline decarboxylase [Pseudomonas alliivorans]